MADIEETSSGWGISWIGAEDLARLVKTYSLCDEDLHAAAHLYEEGQRDALLSRKLRSLATVTASGQIVFLSPGDAKKLSDELDALWAARTN